MDLTDLPEFRAKVEEFERAGTDLLAAIDMYETHGVRVFGPPEQFNISRAVFHAREALKTE